MLTLHCCSHYCILGALLGPHAPLEPTQHTRAAFPRKVKRRTGTKKLFCFGATAAGSEQGGFTGRAAHVCWTGAPSPALFPWKEVLGLPAVAPAVCGEEVFSSSSAKRLPGCMLEGFVFYSRCGCTFLRCAWLVMLRGGCWGWWWYVRQWLSGW